MGFLIDTDNNAATGGAPTYLDMNGVAGCDAWGIFYPFRGNATSASGTDGNLSIVNGPETQGAVALYSGSASKPESETTKSNVTAFGTADDTYAYLEVGIPRAAIGNPSGTMKIQFSFSYDCSEAVEINI